MKVMLLNKVIKYLLFKPKFKIETLMVQFKLHNIQNTTYHD